MMTEPTTNSVGPACDLSAIAPDQRAAHQALAGELMREALHERLELPDGYAFRFAAERYDDITRFVANERLCCPFFAFTLEVTPEQGPLWLRITGREGAKALLEGDLLG
jgi:hypothetical protein